MKIKHLPQIIVAGFAIPQNLSIWKKAGIIIGYMYFIGVLVLVMTANIYMRHHPFKHHWSPPIKEQPIKKANNISESHVVKKQK